MKETGRNITLPRIVIGLIVIASVESLGQGVACDSVYTIVDQMPIYGTGIRDFMSILGKT